MPSFILPSCAAGGKRERKLKKTNFIPGNQTRPWYLFIFAILFANRGELADKQAASESGGGNSEESAGDERENAEELVVIEMQQNFI